MKLVNNDRNDKARANKNHRHYLVIIYLYYLEFLFHTRN